MCANFPLTAHSEYGFLLDRTQPRYSWMCTMSKESCYSCCSRAVLTGSAAMCSRKHRIFFLKKGGDSLPVIKLMLIWLAWEALGGMHTKLPCGNWRAWCCLDPPHWPGGGRGYQAPLLAAVSWLHEEKCCSTDEWSDVCCLCQIWLPDPPWIQLLCFTLWPLIGKLLIPERSRSDSL